jgi:hypothetical protein
MKPYPSRIIFALAALLAAPAVQAQQAQTALQPAPHFGYVYPAGGRQGTPVEVTAGGQFLRSVTGVHVSGEGVQVSVGKYSRPLTAEEFFRLQDKLKEVQKRFQTERASAGAAGAPALYQKIMREVGVTQDDVKAFREFGMRAIDPKREINFQIAETVVLRIKIAPNAPPGERELRLMTASGLSNPLVFQVGQLPECCKSGASAASETEVREALPAVLNGQILRGGVDRFGFKARQGMRLVAAASARDLVPYLADAVPGWFQAALTLYDPNGNEVAYADDYRFQPDPVLYYEVPTDGRYVLEIKDALFRGRQDFVYRLTLGELPFVSGIFPLGGRRGTPTTVELSGWNLPMKSLTLDGSNERPGMIALPGAGEQALLRSVPFARDTLPECLEKEPNNEPATAQSVTPPVIVNGRIGQPGDWDVFRIEGRAGSEMVAEVYARRLGSPLDSVLKLTDAAGKVLAVNDDYEDKGAPLLTHQADSRISATLPADGTYYLHLGDTQHKGGPEYAYRLRISPPRPDFELRVVPSSVNVRAGACAPITVYALRRDGFAGDIALELNDAPSGFALSGGLVPAGQDKVRLTLTAPPTATDKPLSLSLAGRAMIGGKEISRPAVPAEDMLQAFAYHHLVPARELLVAVSRRRQESWYKLVDEKRVPLPAGKTARVRFSMPRGMMMVGPKLALSDPPEGITIQSVVPSGGSVDLVLLTDAAKVKPGLRGNLMVDVSIDMSPGAAKGKPAGEKRRVPIGSLPAIPFEVVAM